MKKSFAENNLREVYRVCDPLYGYIHFDKEEQKVIEHPYFQRLRSIQQLGFVQYAYPGAVNNRFIHSLGVCHLAGRAFDSVFSGPEATRLPLTAKRKKEFRKALRLSALLHDIGHGPLSHTCEFLMPPLKQVNPKSLNGDRPARHEDYTLQFIRDSELTGAIQGAGMDPLWIARLLNPETRGGEDFFQEKGWDFLPLLRQIISSDLDVDRMDYIHRDSYFCGVNYGLVDYRWLLSHLTFHEKGKKLYLALNQEALWTAESFLLGRHHIHLTVYFHHKPMVYEKMLERYRDSEPVPWTLPGNVDSFAQWTDNTVFEKLKAAKNNEWAQRIRDKNPYKRVFEWGYFSPEGGSAREERRIKSLEKKLSNENIPFISANSSNHPLKPVLSDDGENNVFVKNRWTGEAKSLFDQQAIFKLQKRQIHRIYVDLKDRERAQKLLRSNQKI